MIDSTSQPEPAGALAMLDRYPQTIPICSQVPRKSFLEGMILQYTEGFPGMKADDKKRFGR
jgi:hypothetical protein